MSLDGTRFREVLVRLYINGHVRKHRPTYTRNVLSWPPPLASLSSMVVSSYLPLFVGLHRRLCSRIYTVSLSLYCDFLDPLYLDIFVLLYSVSNY